MTIRNKTTGETRVIGTEEAPKYGLPPTTPPESISKVTPEPNRLSNLLPLVTGGLGGLIGSILGPLGIIGGAGLGAATGEGLRQTYRGMQGTGPLPGGQDIGQVAKAGAAGTAGGAAVATPLALAPFLKYLSSPTQLPFIGPRLEKLFANAGEITPKTLESIKKIMGTRMSPNVQPFAGIAPGGQEGVLRQLLKKEIGALGRTASGERAMPTYQRLFELRRGAYGEAASGGAYNQIARLFGKSPSPESKFYGKYGQILSNLLHEGVPKSEFADKLYSGARSYEKIPQAFRRAASVGIPAYLTYSLLRRLMPRREEY